MVGHLQVESKNGLEQPQIYFGIDALAPVDKCHVVPLRI
jgi:hypothetical protein